MRGVMPRLCLFAFLLAGCGGTETPVTSPNEIQQEAQKMKDENQKMFPNMKIK